ncbi:MAG: hypothetical protein LBR80_05365 [Deltaproteobacteria bacterium]|nr:hypothetical protein [Deltaproteobacteria bacterium]
MTELEKDKGQLVAAQEKFATKGDIEAALNKILLEIVGINGKVDALNCKADALKGEVDALKGEVGALKGEVGDIKVEQGTLMGKMDGLDKRVGMLSSLMVVIFGTILAGVIGLLVKLFGG